MKITKLYKNQFKKLISAALKEDAPAGDITSNIFISQQQQCKAQIIARQKGTLSGIELTEACFKYLDKNISFASNKQDGAAIKINDVIATICGSSRNILKAERIALNFLQHMSGIATMTADYVQKLKNSHTKLLDTRKTAPGLRIIDKYAVNCGGGTNHRLGLSDMFLVKENHFSALSKDQIIDTLRKIKSTKRFNSLKVEVEAETIDQVQFLLALPIDIILLDNMNTAQIKKCVKLRNKINKKIKLEASGNITLNSLTALANTEVDYISCGAITHSAPSFNFSLLIKG